MFCKQYLDEKLINEWCGRKWMWVFYPFERLVFKNVLKILLINIWIFIHLLVYMWEVEGVTIGRNVRRWLGSKLKIWKLETERKVLIGLGWQNVGPKWVFWVCQMRCLLSTTTTLQHISPVQILRNKVFATMHLYCFFLSFNLLFFFRLNWFFYFFNLLY